MQVLIVIACQCGVPITVQHYILMLISMAACAIREVGLYVSYMVSTDNGDRLQEANEVAIEQNRRPKQPQLYVLLIAIVRGV